MLAQDRSDPHNLDPSGDGFACASLPSQVTVTRLPATGTGTMAGILACGADRGLNRVQPDVDRANRVVTLHSPA